MIFTQDHLASLAHDIGANTDATRVMRTANATGLRRFFLICISLLSNETGGS
ncbi:hypothetical protein JCM18920_3005 [Cutibacterium acnes JCM 18920]|nr:hypothetical protein JCM18920_3005 [Cutibacterium acnes JCM 18920]